MNNGMNPLKYGRIYICVEYPTYVRLQIVIQMKFNTNQDCWNITCYCIEPIYIPGHVTSNC